MLPLITAAVQAIFRLFLCLAFADNVLWPLVEGTQIVDCKAACGVLVCQPRILGQ